MADKDCGALYGRADHLSQSQMPEDSVGAGRPAREAGEVPELPDGSSRAGRPEAACQNEQLTPFKRTVNLTYGVGDTVTILLHPVTLFGLRSKDLIKWDAGGLCPW